MPLCSPEDLQRMIDRHKGKRGLRKAKAAVAKVRTALLRAGWRPGR
jgi:hypothetical protein